MWKHHIFCHFEDTVLSFFCLINWLEPNQKVSPFVKSYHLKLYEGPDSASQPLGSRLRVLYRTGNRKKWYFLSFRWYGFDLLLLNKLTRTDPESIPACQILSSQAIWRPWERFTASGVSFTRSILRGACENMIFSIISMIRFWSTFAK